MKLRRRHGGGAAEAREVGAYILRLRRQRVQIDIGGKRTVSGVHPENRPARGLVGMWYVDLDIEPAGPQEGRIEQV